MRKVDSLCFYDKDLNFWLRPEGDLLVIGVTDFSQEFLGTLTLITDLPTIGSTLKRYTILAIVESDKTTTELIMPINAVVLDVNQALLAQPNLINEDCYGKGWLVKVKPLDFNENDFLTAAAYEADVAVFFNK